MDRRIKRTKLIRASALALSIAVITLGLFGASKIKTSFSMEIFGLSDEIELNQYQTLQSKFAKNQDFLIFGFRSKSPIENFDEFNRFDSFVHRLDGTKLFDEVHFLTTMNYPRKNGFIVTQSKFLPRENKSQFDQKYAELDKYPDITRKFLSKDRKSICVYGFLKRNNLSQKEIERLNNLTHSVGPLETFVIGGAYNQSQANDFLKIDALKMSAISFVLIICLFFLFYPSLKKLLFFTWELLFCVSSFYLIIYLLNIELNVLTITIPIIITTLSLSDTVHIISVAQGNEKSIQKENFLRIKTPLLLSTITTIAGFAVFVITRNTIIIEFSILASLGLISSYIIARYWSPSIFWLLVKSKKATISKWDAFSKFILSLISKHYKVIVASFVVFTAISIAYVFNTIRVDSFLQDRLDVRIEPGKSIHFYQQNFSGPRQIEMFIESDSSLLTEEGMTNVSSIEKYLIHEYGAISCQSINTSLKRLERFMHNGLPEHYQLPHSLSVRIKHNLNQYSDKLGLSGSISNDRKTLRIVAITPDFGSKRTLEKNKSLQAYLQSILPANHSFYIGGPTTINDRATIKISSLLIWGLLAGILSVVLFLLFYFRSPWIAFAGGVVNFIPLLAVLLYYSIIERNIGPNDFMLLSILLGVAIDDSIHLLSRIKMTSDDILQSLQMVMQPMIISSILLIGGFSALMFSFSPDNRLNGIAFIIGITTALITDLILLPSLLILKNKNKYLQPN